VSRCGRGADVIALLLIPLLLGGAAAAPTATEKAYRDARTAVDRGETGAAGRKADAALARFAGIDDGWVQALRVLKGEVLARTRNFVGARELLQPELPAKYRSTEAAVWRLIGLGMADTTKNARVLFEEARKLAAAKQPRLLFAVHQALANVSDDPDKDLEIALDLARRDGNRLGIALVRSAMVYRYVGEGRYAEAIDAGNSALPIFEAVGASGRAATTAGNLGWAYLELGDWESARELLTKAEANAARAGNPASRLLWQNQLGNIEAQMRRYAHAERMYRSALQLAGDDGSRTAMILTNLARVAFDTGRLPDAQRLLAEALAAKPDAEQALSTQTVEARLATMAGEHARAEKTLRNVIARTERPATRWAAQGHLAQLYARIRRNQEAEAAYREALATASQARKAVNSAELALSFFNTSAEVFNGYVGFLVRNKRHDDALALTETLRAQTLEEGLGLPAAPRKPDVRAIAREQGAVVLSYWLGRDGSHLWVVTASDVVYEQLPPDSVIERDVSAYRRDLLGLNGTLKGSGARGQQLYRTLVEPAKIAKGSRVVVVADGVLHALNFETLVVPGPKPHYWIEDVVVSSAGSLQLLARDEAKKSTGAAMLLVGDPPVADAAFPKLTYAAEEIRTVAGHFDRPVVLSGAKATPAAYRAAARERFAFVHFVAHGVSSLSRPLDSAVILGRDASKQYKLYARDIVMHPLDARLVTISSCYGAGERTFAGEGLVGLAWAFLRAGANQVIAALWEVNDSATPKLMDRMYAGVRAGRDPAVALRDAKLTLVKGKGVYQMPRYWAPFVLYSGH
jgi:CHAT domain-containing protein